MQPWCPGWRSRSDSLGRNWVDRPRVNLRANFPPATLAVNLINPTVDFLVARIYDHVGRSLIVRAPCRGAPEPRFVKVGVGFLFAPGDPPTPG